MSIGGARDDDWDGSIKELEASTDFANDRLLIGRHLCHPSSREVAQTSCSGKAGKGGTQIRERRKRGI